MITKISLEALLKDPTNTEAIIRSLFGLSHMDYMLLVSLYQLEETDIDTLMEHTGNAWFRNKVTTGLNRLIQKNLCTRRKIKGDPKRRYKFKYIYKPKPINQLIVEITERLELWVTNVTEQLKTLEEQFQKEDTKAYQKQREKREKIKKEWFKDKD